MWLKGKSLFLEVCDNHAPIRTKRVRDSRDRLKIIASVTKTTEDWSNFKMSLNQVNNAIKNAKGPIITILLKHVMATHVKLGSH